MEHHKGWMGRPDYHNRWAADPDCRSPVHHRHPNTGQWHDTSRRTGGTDGTASGQPLCPHHSKLRRRARWEHSVGDHLCGSDLTTGEQPRRLDLGPSPRRRPVHIAQRTRLDQTRGHRMGHGHGQLQRHLSYRHDSEQRCQSYNGRRLGRPHRHHQRTFGSLEWHLDGDGNGPRSEKDTVLACVPDGL